MNTSPEKAQNIQKTFFEYLLVQLYKDVHSPMNGNSNVVMYVRTTLFIELNAPIR